MTLRRGYHDAVSGLVKVGVRTTHPPTAAPPSRPVVTPGTPAHANTYACVGNNPINIVDPGAGWGDIFGPVAGSALKCAATGAVMAACSGAGCPIAARAVGRAIGGFIGGAASSGGDLDTALQGALIEAMSNVATRGLPPYVGWLVAFG